MKDMKRAIVRAALFTPFSRGRWGLPIALCGQPGIAKSAVVIEVCEELGMPVEVLEPGARGEAAFGVVPVPVGTGAGMRLVSPRPSWTDKFLGESGTDKIPGVVFVDEITTAPPMIQAALLGLILERRIGETILPSCTRVIAAYNPPEQAAGGYDLAAPLANRMGHLQWDPPSVEEHATYMLRSDTGNGAHEIKPNVADALEKQVMRKWPLEFATARGLEVAFLRAFPHHKNKCPKPGDPQSSAAWPSDRSWEMATRAYAGAVCHQLTQEEREEFVSAYIGSGVANEWFAFIEKQDMPNPADYLDGKIKFAHDKKRVDRTMALASACTALVTPEKADKRKDRAAALWNMIAESITSDAVCADIFVPAALALVNAALFNKSQKGLDAIGPLLDAANIQH